MRVVHFLIKSDNSLAFWSIGASKVTTVSHIGAVCKFEKLKSDDSIAYRRFGSHKPSC